LNFSHILYDRSRTHSHFTRPFHTNLRSSLQQVTINASIDAFQLRHTHIVFLRDGPARVPGSDLVDALVFPARDIFRWVSARRCARVQQAKD
jgi:hypothetical protein